jgi:hypothetical protein
MTILNLYLLELYSMIHNCFDSNCYVFEHSEPIAKTWHNNLHATKASTVYHSEILFMMKYDISYLCTTETHSASNQMYSHTQTSHTTFYKLFSKISVANNTVSQHSHHTRTSIHLCVTRLEVVVVVLVGVPCAVANPNIPTLWCWAIPDCAQNRPFPLSRCVCSGECEPERRKKNLKINKGLLTNFIGYFKSLCDITLSAGNYHTKSLQQIFSHRYTNNYCFIFQWILVYAHKHGSSIKDEWSPANQLFVMRQIIVTNQSGIRTSNLSATSPTVHWT